VRAGRRTTANERSFNNEQGLPVTILNAPDDTEVLILEMGMRGFGHISQLCEIARPDIGVVTVVGHAHTELVGGIDGVARAKGELVEALPASGTAVLNADDERVVAMRSRTGADVVTFGGPATCASARGARRPRPRPLPARHAVGER
jgi:UDP-N-acetylmuramoyl-tripeptide--D-alanyl-D-alanine ligase